MPFKIICSCGVALLAGDTLAKFKVACPECGGYTQLPEVPDPYRLPTNAEMVSLEDVVTTTGSKRSKNPGTVRRRGGNPGAGYAARGARRGEEEVSSVNLILLIILIVILIAILGVGFSYLMG